MAKTEDFVREIAELPAVMNVSDLQKVMGLSKVTAYNLVKNPGVSGCKNW